MAYNDIIYPLLRIKMAEVNIDIKKIADGIGANRTTLSKKFSGESEPSLPLARQIRDTYFPGVLLEDLFDPNYKPIVAKESGAA